MSFHRSLANSFDNAAELYHQTRPRYPKALIRKIIEYSRVKKDDQLLDIGCGSGLLLENFYGKRLQLTGIDISPQLLRIAQKTAKKKKERVAFFFDNFQKHRFAPKAFSLALSGQAFHWFPPTSSIQKVFRLLKPNGTFAVVGYGSRCSLPDLRDNISRLLSAKLRYRYSPSTRLMKVYDQLTKNSDWVQVRLSEQTIRKALTPAQFIDLTFSASYIIALPANQKKVLRRQLLAIIGKRKTVPIEFRFRLILAKKKKVG